MIAEKIVVKNFRNIESAALELKSGINVLYGPNGSGKTSLAEALYFFSVGKSFRVIRPSMLVKYGEIASEAELVFTDDANSRRTAMKYTVPQNGSVYYEVNRFSCIRKAFVGNFLAVMYTPETPALIIKGTPEAKRDFMNIALCRINPMYTENVSMFAHAMEEACGLVKARNDLAYRIYGRTKNLPYDERLAEYEAQLLLYKDTMCKAAGYVFCQRSRFCKLLESCMREFLTYVYDGEFEVDVEYKPGIEGGDRPLASVGEFTSAIDSDLTTSLAEDMENGRPSYGIHKDSIVFRFNGIEAKNIASQGQLRILGIALKFAEGVTIKAMGGGELPMFILDDVMSELDRKTQLKITEIFSPYQTVITSADMGYLDTLCAFSASMHKGFTLPAIFTVAGGVFGKY